MARVQSERQIIEEYLRTHCIQECLDEVINDLIVSRPLNPYVAITKMMETKTLAEIIDVNLCSVIVGGGNSGVLATVYTNIGAFSAIVAYPYSHYDRYRNYPVRCKSNLLFYSTYPFICTSFII